MINQASADLIKEFEGLRLKAYKCSAGVWTIGWGTTAAAGVGIEPKAGMVITEAQAKEYFDKAISKFSLQIRPLIKVAATENEFGAMVSLAYNIGPSAFARSSVLKRFNAGDKAGAADAFLMWNKAGGKVLKGLVRRRDAERKLFLTPAPQPPRKLPHNPLPQPPAPPKRGFWSSLFTALAGIARGR